MNWEGSLQGVKPPKNVIANRIHDPDMDAMIRALQIVLEWDKQKKAG